MAWYLAFVNYELKKIHQLTGLLLSPKFPSKWLKKMGCLKVPSPDSLYFWAGEQGWPDVDNF